MEFADIGSRFLQNGQEFWVNGGHGFVDFFFAYLQCGELGLVKLLAVGQQGRIAVLPNIGDDIGDDVRHIEGRLDSGEDILGSDFAEFHDFNHFDSSI